MIDTHGLTGDAADELLRQIAANTDAARTQLQGQLTAAQAALTDAIAAQTGLTGDELEQAQQLAADLETECDRIAAAITAAGELIDQAAAQSTGGVLLAAPLVTPPNDPPDVVLKADLQAAVAGAASWGDFQTVVAGW